MLAVLSPMKQTGDVQIFDGLLKRGELTVYLKHFSLQAKNYSTNKY